MKKMSNPFMAALGGGQMPGPAGQFQRMMQQLNQLQTMAKQIQGFLQ